MKIGFMLCNMHTLKILAVTFCLLVKGAASTIADDSKLPIQWSIEPTQSCRDLFEAKDPQSVIPDIQWKDLPPYDDYDISRYRYCNLKISGRRSNGTLVKNFSLKTSTYEAYVGDRYVGNRKFDRSIRSIGKTSITIQLPIFYRGCVYNVIRFATPTMSADQKNNRVNYGIVGLDQYRCDV